MGGDFLSEGDLAERHCIKSEKHLQLRTGDGGGGGFSKCWITAAGKFHQSVQVTKTQITIKIIGRDGRGRNLHAQRILMGHALLHL